MATVNLTGVSLDPKGLNLTQPVVGDLDLDGHPDVIVPVLVSNVGSRRPLVLMGSARGRLHPQLELFSEAAVANVTQTAFFDLWEDVSGEHSTITHPLCPDLTPKQ